MVINEIDAALANHASYEDKLALLVKYGNNAALIHSLKSRQDRQSRLTLDHELKRLRWKPGVALAQKEAKVKTEKKVVEAVSKIPLRVKNRFIDDTIPGENRLYPSVIEKAIQDRQKAINRREKAGRVLVEQADSIAPDRRAEMIRVQKEEHKIVMAATAVIQTWKQTGVLPSEGENYVEISDEKRGALEKEWTDSLRDLSRAKKSLVNWGKKGNQKKVDSYQEKIKSLDKRLNELAPILGKKRRGN
jgi:hypothetical protein